MRTLTGFDIKFWEAIESDGRGGQGETEDDDRLSEAVRVTFEIHKIRIFLIFVSTSIFILPFAYSFPLTKQD